MQLTDHPFLNQLFRWKVGSVKMRVGIMTILLYLIEAKGHSYFSKKVEMHDCIGDKINPLMKLLQATTMKLENYELREKQLGNQLKNALEGLDTRMRSQECTINEIKVKLMQIEEDLNQKSKQDESWISNVEGVIKNQTPSTDLTVSKHQLEKIESIVSSKIDFVASIVGRFEKELLDTITQLKSAINNDGLYSKLESQLVVHEKWHNLVMGKLEHFESTNEELLACRKQQTDNDTIEALAEIKNEIQHLGSNELMNINLKLQEFMRSINVKSLIKAEKVLSQTADTELESKNRIEDNFQKILFVIGELVKSQTKELNFTVNNWLNEISELILKNQNDTAFNLSFRIDEISQVWQIIRVMQEQHENSDYSLSGVQQQLEQYLNGSLSMKDSMNSHMLEIMRKVSDITENVSSLKESLLFVTQEFRKTKGDLLTAFENLNNNIQSVGQEIKHQRSTEVHLDDIDVRGDYFG